MDGEVLLGPIPSGYRVEGWYPNGFETVTFCHVPTEERDIEDPRLPPLPSEWESVERERTQDDPMFLRVFRNKITSEMISSDPRMTPEALERRGVALQKFRLV